MFGYGRYIDQTFHDTRESFDKRAKWLLNNNFDVYFGCAKYGDADNRKQENAEYFHALWMDIDCGEKKAKPNPEKNGKIEGYIDQPTAFAAFKDFCKAHKLPRPVVVDSGYGLHFYWILAEVVRRREWEALSHRLRDVALEHGLIVDTSVFEASRVLRVPGTLNFKNNVEAPVRVLSEKHDVTPYSVWKELIGAPEPEEDRSFIPRRLSPLMESLMENRTKRFKTIMMKSAQGEGCQQLLHCFQNQDKIDYNLWRSALSIATHCVDRDTAIHKMSSRHPGYNEGETELKAADIGGPHHCTTFERQNPGGCDGCSHKGRFKSPISLGIEIAEVLDDGEGEEGGEESEGTSVPVEIPEPYFRSKNGAVYRRASDEEEEPTLVYENLIYVVKRMHDPGEGEVALVRLHLPRDGVREFSVPLSTIVVKEKLREKLAQNGVAAGQKQMEALSTYLIVFIKNLQVANKAELMRTQFGWADGDTKIIIGDREIGVEGTYYSPPSVATKTVSEYMRPMGTLEKWKEVFNLYAAPGLEANAFAALTAFGSPLLKFAGVSGAIINLIHSSSGSGKSTALFMCNSVIGHPRNLASIWKDTFNAKMHRLGVMNNFANTVDEITNTSPQEFSDLAYSISQGRGKNRMKSQSNEERVNTTTWQGITLTSSNASFYEKLGIAKDSPDGESMRLLEYRITPSKVIPVEIGKRMFDHQLMENYGHAGDIYCEWLVKHRDEAIDNMRQIQAKIDRDVKFSSRERFWSATCAAIITGGLIAKSYLKLHDYDMRAVYNWMVNMLENMRHDVAAPLPEVTGIIGDFINNHVNNVVVVNGFVDARTHMEALPSVEPKGELHIRYEPDTKRMFITVQALRKYCVERQINYRDLCNQLEEKRVLVGIINKRISKGMKLVSPAVRVLELDTTQGDFLRVDSYVTQDAD